MYLYIFICRKVPILRITFLVYFFFCLYTALKVAHFKGFWCTSGADMNIAPHNPNHTIFS